MPRPLRPIDPSAGPVQAFAAELRLVREKAGSPKFLQMARASGRSRTALSEAVGGDHLPTWETVEAFLLACGEPPGPWQIRWDQVRAQLEAAVAPPAEHSATAAVDHDGTADQDGAVAEPLEPTNNRRRARIALLVLAGLAAVTATVIVLIPAPHRPYTDAPPTLAPSGPVAAVVANKIATGSDGLLEDSTPAYLSTRPIPFCARNGCQVPATTMWGGAIVQVLCQRDGATMTNADTTSTGIEHNPHAATSSRWYLATIPSGATGYIAEVYLAPASRGGLNLPPCPPG
ncbi:helix-turn-helix transcriptional regulator [Micromonospora sp. NPDC047187]|uniref:helix-turn-helix domain-containing protein n=1 Tax=Micromonospora sp. NPDC047187 TaxID=3155262 RepID=UPI0033F9A957